MLIEHKIVSNYVGRRVLTNKTTWLEPSNIVSIEIEYVRVLDMNYTKLTTTDSRTYNVFDQACRQALSDYQNHKPEPSSFGKYSKKFLTAGLVTLMCFGISTGAMYFHFPHPQSINNRQLSTLIPYSLFLIPFQEQNNVK